MVEGKVYLVGAGLGNPAYLTLRANYLLSQAQVLVYDALVDAQLLKLVPDNCLQLDVGKRGGKLSTPQSEINQLLVKYCQQGKQVVRLKSGDPFIFGRSRAEIIALKAADCEWEVVPGISSVLAAPLLAGIPLTDKAMSSCFAVFTAHQPEILDWQALSRLETLVVLMGGQHLNVIIQQLQLWGRSPQTLIAIIRWAGTYQQQIWTGTLETIVAQTEGVQLSPVVIVIGEVVGLREALKSENIYLKNILDQRALGLGTMTSTPPHSSPDEYLPLQGKTVLVTRSAGQSSKFRELLANTGAKVIEMPALEICPPSSWDSLDRAIANLSNFHWLIFTSTNGVDYFFERLMTQNKDIRALTGVKIAVVGKKTAQSLQQRYLQADFIPPDFIADSLVAHFPEPLAEKKVLFPRVESGGREILVQELNAQGAEVIEVAAYQSCCPTSIPPEVELALQGGAIDVITFASSKTVKFFSQLARKIYSDSTLEDSSILANALEEVCIASIGPQTSIACNTYLGRVDVEAQEYTLDGLTQALIKWAAG